MDSNCSKCEKEIKELKEDVKILKILIRDLQENVRIIQKWKTNG